MSMALEDQEFLESLKQEFLDETLENLQKCEDCLLKFERSKDDELIREYLRLLHSIKGSARAVEFDKVATTIHQIETLGHKSADAQFVEISLSLLDDLRVVMGVIKQGNLEAMGALLDTAIKKAVL